MISPGFVITFLNSIHDPAPFGFVKNTIAQAAVLRNIRTKKRGAILLPKNIFSLKYVS